MKMTCQAMNSWTFSELVAAFLDLSIAYCLLCASAFAFFASRFLALFGLCLPCPCDGLFWNPRNNSNSQLVDCPYEKISSVYFSVKSKLPFDSVLRGDEQNGNSHLKLENEGNHGENGECGTSSSSSPGTWFHDLVETDVKGKTGADFGAVNFEGLKEEEYGAEGQRVVEQRRRHGLWRGRKGGGSVNYGKASSVSSYDTLQSDARNIPQSPPSISKMGNEVSEGPNDYGDDREATTDFGSLEGVSLGLESNNSNDDCKHAKREVVSIEESGRGAQGDFEVDKNEKNTIRLLEQALEEEHAACSALYLELEKERSAAASAADEAMAMILRLQKEKASIEMEARQYQRMIEAKAAYDADKPQANSHTEQLRK